MIKVSSMPTDPRCVVVYMGLTTSLITPLNRLRSGCQF